MKKNLLLIFLVLPFFALAQKYHPFPFKTIQYSYAEGDSLYILKKDSLSSDGEIYFNPIVKFDPETTFLMGTIDSNNIFGQKLVAISDTAYVFVSAQKDSFFIDPYAKLNTPFVFTQTVDAQIVSREKELVLGVMDSVIAIELTTGEIIKLSENYGFVQTTRLDQLGQNSAMNFVLSAIPEANLGKYFYDPANIYDFEVGDVFVYGSGFYSDSYFKILYEYLVRREIVEKIVFPDSIIYSYQDIKRTFRYGNYGKDTLINSIGKEVIYLNEIIDNPSFSYDEIPNFSGQIFNGTAYVFKEKMGINFGIGKNNSDRYTATNRSDYYDYLSMGTELHVVPDAGSVRIYTLGLGLVYENTRTDNHNELVCYTKQNESYGDCDSLFTVILSNKPTKVSESINLFPNPAKDKITISNLGKSQCSIWSITGQRIGEQNINESGELDISRLSPGVYMLLVNKPEGNVHLRFEKL